MSKLDDWIVEHGTMSRWNRLSAEERVQHTLENSELYRTVQSGKILAEKMRQANERIQHQDGKS